MSRAKNNIQVSLRQKRLLYGSTVVLWLSGVAWLYLQFLAPAPVGLASHPTQLLWMRIHGAAAIAFLLIFGVLIEQHIPAGWRENRQRPSGMWLTGVCALLVLTGWGLYYIGDEHLRPIISWVHHVLGFVLPLIIVLHIIGVPAKTSKTDHLHLSR